MEAGESKVMGAVKGLKGIEHQFGEVAAVVAAAVAVTKVGFDIYQKGFKQSYLDWGTSLGREMGIIAQEGQRADEILGKQLDEKIEAMNRRRAELAAAKSQAVAAL
jgi:hypothetical protein